MPLRATRTDIFVATITTFLFGSYDAFEENLTHMKIINLKTYLGENVTDFCAEILVDAELLESAGAFKPHHLGYINFIFEDTSDSRLCLRDIYKYKEVMEFINKLCVSDMDVLSQEDIISYESLVHEAT